MPGPVRAPFLSTAVIVCLGVLPVAAAPPDQPDTRFLIEPGPTVQSEEEKALVADPARGMQHGVILLEEMLRDESGTDDRIVYHMRAKVLSTDMRGLGEIYVPVKKIRTGDFKKWWARNILPDGRVIELKKEDLKEEVVADAGFGFKERSVKGALPSIEVGSVIDYGFEVRGNFFDRYERIRLQDKHFIRKFRYKWVPYPGYGASYYLRRRPDLNVSVTKAGASILIEATDMPPVEEEPYMPPDDSVRASVIRYYWMATDLPAEQEGFWKAHARNTEQEVATFLKKDKGIKEAIAGLTLAPDDGTQDKARAVYEWIQQNVKNTSLLTAEQLDAKIEAEKKDKKHHAYAYMPQDTAQSVLETKEGTQGQIQDLFIGMMRAMGLQAHEVLAPDRSQMLWDERMLIPWQLSESLVFVKAPGEEDSKGLFLAPGSGLPFGTTEWWVAPAIALLADETGGRKIPVPTMPPEGNVLATRAQIAYPEDGSRATFTWSASSTGQRGHETRRGLGLRSPDERAKRLDELCGAVDDTEITKAEAPGFSDVTSAFRIECEGEKAALPIDAEESSLTRDFAGPWIPPVPQLLGSKRTYPIVMPYARTDRTSIDIEAPVGFLPAAPPPKVSYQSGLGRYELNITARENTFHIERTLTLPIVAMKKEAYPDLQKFLADVRIADATLLEFERGGEQP